MTSINQTLQEEQVVVFQLMEQVYGIDINSVFEIIRMESITKLPRTPDFVEGVINLRGRIIPVIDLGLRFGLGQSERTQASRIIIVEVSGQKIGMIVDSVQEVLRIPTASIEPPPPVVNGVDATYLRGIAILEDKLVILLDQDKILYEKEKELLQQANIGGDQAWEV